MISLPRNPEIERPSLHEVLFSGQLSEQVKNAKGKALKSKEPFTDKTNVPEGLFMLNKTGLVFLYFDPASIKQKDGGKNKEGLMGKFAEEAAVKVASEVIPFGGVAVRLLIGTVKSATKPKVAPDVDWDAILRNPATFAIPFVDIVSVDFRTVGGFFKENFLFVEAETEPGVIASYCMKCELFSKSFERMLFMFRFGSERAALAESILEEKLGKTAKIKEIALRLKEKYGDDTDKLIKELQKEYEDYAAKTMQEKGITRDSVDNLVREKMMHFRKISPQLNELVGKYLSGR